LRTVEFSSLLISLRYHLVIFSSRPCTCAATGPSNRLSPCYDYNQSCMKGFSVSLPLLETLCVSALWYVDTLVTFLLSRHFNTVTGPEFLAMISPYCSCLFFTSLGTFFLFSFSVTTQSVECSIFSFLANSGLLKMLSSHSVCP